MFEGSLAPSLKSATTRLTVVGEVLVHGRYSVVVAEGSRRCLTRDWAARVMSVQVEAWQGSTVFAKRMIV